MDDIIIHSSTIEEHFQRIEHFLERFIKADLKLKPSKCELFKSVVLFLGHIVGRDGLRPNPKTLETVEKWEIPKTVKEAHQILGLGNYYRQFVPGFSGIASPLK